MRWAVLLIVPLLAGCLTTSVAPSLTPEESAFYDPVERNIEGWGVRIDPRLFEKAHAELGAKALDVLRFVLEGIKHQIPEKRLAELQSVKIWVELESPVGTAMQYHPDPKWLIKNNLDPRLVECVHIPSADRLAKKSFFHAHPSVVMHELSHGFHHQFLGYGYKPIIDAYEAGVASGAYGKVLHNSGRQRDHYGGSNYKEYFAEGCEAYFGTNDFFPFVRAELKQHDPKLYAIMQEIWGK